MTSSPNSPNSWEQIYSEHLEQLGELSKSPVHSYIFSGPQAFPRIGALAESAPPPLLRYAARRFASLVFEKYSPEDASLAEAELHPNLRVIEPAGRTFRVVDADIVAEEAYLTPQGEQDKKVIVCDRFHTADESTATKLLKVIEEPPEHTILILLAEQRLPITIASRCVEKEIPPLPHSKVREYLAGQNFDAEQSEIIGAAASGDLGRAHFLISGGYADKRLELWDGVYEMLAGAEGDSHTTGLEIAEQVLAVRSFLDEVLETLDTGDKTDESLKRERRRIRDIEIKFGLSILARRYMEQLGEETSVEQNSRKVKALNQAGEDLRHNPNETAFFTDLFFKLVL